MFVKTIGPKPCKIMLIGEAPGADEDAQGIPFIGAAGKTLTWLLQQSGISRNDCAIANVARIRPPNNDISKYYTDKKLTIPTPQMQEWIELLKAEIVEYNPNIIVALGSTAQYTLTNERNITNFRGFITRSILLPSYKVISTYHPQAINHEYKLHFTSIMDLRKALRHSEFKEIPPDRRKLHASISFNDFMSYISEMSKFDTTAPPIAVDIETCQPNSHIHIIGLADSPSNAYSFEILKDRKPTLSQEDEFILWKSLDNLFQKRTLLMHNGSYDAAVLMQNNGIYCKNFSLDTLIAAHVCWPECPRSLGYLSSICLDVPAWKHTNSSMPTLYNAADAANTWGIWEVLKNELEKKNLMDVFEFEMSQLEPAMMLQLQGMKVNEEVRMSIKTKSESRIKELEEELGMLTGKKVNYSSPKQLQQLLYIDLELPVQYKRRKSADEDRKISADAESIKKLWLKTHNPVLEKIMELKKLIKLVTGFLSIKVSPTGTVNTCYNVTGATMARETKGFAVDDEGAYKSFGRWSSSKSIILPYGSGNLMNIPKKARKMFTAPEGKVLLQADYCQAEAVVVAYLTGDAKLKKMFSDAYGKPKSFCKENNLDVHKVTAAIMFRKDVSLITTEERNIGKTIRHAVSYSAGPAVLSARLDISLRDAKSLLQTYHNANPHLQVWQARIQEELRRTRTLTNLFGRRHYFLSRWGDELFRSAYSFMPQSTVGDLLNKSLVKIYYNYPELDIVLQLHDALYCFVPKDDVKKYALIMKEAMAIPLQYKTEEFLIDTDFSMGDSWGSMEDYDIYATEDK